MSQDSQRLITASREIAAPAAVLFDLIADPAQQPRWDGNDNLSEAEPGQRVRAVGDIFTMTNLGGGVRENHVVDFAEGRAIAWLPAPQGEAPPGHLWGWQLEPTDGGTLVTHLYDYTQLYDEKRLPKAQAMTPQKLLASIDRLAALVEESAGS
ncbi:MAG: SRPBCC family protein [Brachybacterium sp.]